MQLLLIALLILTALPALGSTVTGGSVTGGSVRAAGGGGPPVANCTDGYTCLCDTITDTYPNVFDCEDFEDPNLANGTNSRGTWHTTYNTLGGVDTCLVDSADPDLWRIGFVGDADAAAANRECLNHAYEGSCEVPGETDCNEDGSGGTYSLGHMFQLNENYGITGEWFFNGGRKSTFSVTFLQKLSSNFTLQGGPAAKTNEFGDSDSAIFGAGNYHSGCSPEVPSNYPFGGGFLTSPSSPVGSPTFRVGAGCNISGIGVMFSTNDAEYDYGTDWSPGEWGCWQGSLNPTGTGNYYRWRVWFTPVGGSATLVLDMDADFTNIIGSDESGFQLMSFNSYFNGPGSPGDGWQLSDPGSRWEDNFVFTSDSTPVPCNAVSSSFPAP